MSKPFKKFGRRIDKKMTPTNNNTAEFFTHSGYDIKDFFEDDVADAFEISNSSGSGSGNSSSSNSSSSNPSSANAKIYAVNSSNPSSSNSSNSRNSDWNEVEAFISVLSSIIEFHENLERIFKFIESEQPLFLKTEVNETIRYKISGKSDSLGTVPSFMHMYIYMYIIIINIIIINIIASIIINIIITSIIIR